MERIIGAALGAMVLATGAQAQMFPGPKFKTVCGTPEAIMGSARNMMQIDRRLGMGITVGDPYVMEMLTGADGSWAILLRHPNGMMCSLGGGTDWQALDEPLPPRGTDG